MTTTKLVRRTCGHGIAMQVARQLVIYMKRPGGQSQFSELLKSQTLSSTAFENLRLWISNNLGDERLNVDLLAERVGMSPRNFARSVDRIARSCGFGFVWSSACASYRSRIPGSQHSPAFQNLPDQHDWNADRDVTRSLEQRHRQSDLLAHADQRGQ